MYYCGIDIAKRKHDAVILDQEGNFQGKFLKITNTASGFEEILSKLQALNSGCAHWHGSDRTLLVGFV